MRLTPVALLLLLAVLAAPAAQADLNHRTFHQAPGSSPTPYYAGQRIWTQADSVQAYDLLGANQVAIVSTVTWTLKSKVISNPTDPATGNSGCGSPGAATASTVTIGTPYTTVLSGSTWSTGPGEVHAVTPEAILGVVPLFQSDSVVESKVTMDLFDLVFGTTTTESDEDHFVVSTGGNAAFLWGLHVGACQELDNLSDLTPNVVDA